MTLTKCLHRYKEKTTYFERKTILKIDDVETAVIWINSGIELETYALKLKVFPLIFFVGLPNA